MNVTSRIITAIATETDESPLDLPPLYKTIDPDALESLLTSTNTPQFQVSFVYCGYQIHVYKDGTIDHFEVKKTEP
ncbi:hypothetical protein GWG54_20180 [Natronococcus sp. JC468]|uniref:HalOD1 output domain-containing protein n=1 Tax=Natronococcus sp. JC468 TaxID=1961921 RepID=UPI00143C6338|nr:hypothetical protein [Natronococcus sp. JC468]